MFFQLWPRQYFGIVSKNLHLLNIFRYTALVLFAIFMGYKRIQYTIYVNMLNFSTDLLLGILLPAFYSNIL